MDYAILASSVVCAATSSIFGGFFNRTCAGKKDTSAFYNLFQLLTVFLGWSLLLALDFDFNVKVIPYSIAFGTAYCLSTFGIINALRTGPVLISTLIHQLSLIATTIWGFFFWGAELKFTVVIGLIFVVAAIYLCLASGKKNDDDKRFSLRWLFYISLAFVGNAGTSIIQRSEQMAFDGKYGNQLMSMALFLGFIFFLIMFLRSDRSDAKFILKKCYIPVGTGVFNLLLNLFVIIMATSSLSPSLIYPTISIGSLIIVTLFSLFAFREKLRTSQWVGVALGISAVLLLSI